MSILQYFLYEVSCEKLLLKLRKEKMFLSLKKLVYFLLSVKNFHVIQQAFLFSFLSDCQTKLQHGNSVQPPGLNSKNLVLLHYISFS